MARRAFGKDQRNRFFPSQFVVYLIVLLLKSDALCREKWTLFEEATRVPLLIAHPQSPFKGQHYSPPVESVDVYATLNELLGLQHPREAVCGVPPHNWVCQPLDGKSLAPVVLGTVDTTASTAAVTSDGTGLRGATPSKRQLSRTKSSASTLLAALMGKKPQQRYTIPSGPLVMAKFPQDFAISQAIRCAPKDRIPNPETAPHRHHTAADKDKGGGDQQTQVHHNSPRSAMWFDCETKKHNPNEMCLLGYSMRTLEYRYTAYYPFNRMKQLPEVTGADTVPYEEELFDHKNETLADFTHREITNLAYRPGYSVIIASFRAKLSEFVLKSFANASPLKEK